MKGIKTKVITIFMTLMLLFSFGSYGQYEGTGTFVKIDNIGDLEAGFYVIAELNDEFAMDVDNDGSFFKHTAISPASGEIANPANNIVWWIEADGSAYTISNIGDPDVTYVSYSGTSNAAYAVVNPASVTDNERWTIAYDVDRFAVTNVAITDRVLQYNAGAPRFACYTSNQRKFNLYKMTEVNTVAAPVFDPSGGTILDPVDVNITTTTPDATVYYSVVSETGPWTEFTAPVAVTETTTIWAYASDNTGTLADSDVASATYQFPVEVTNITDLRAGLTDGTAYKLTGEAILTYQQAFRNKKWVQDADAGIEIDDNAGVITTVYNINDGITGLTGTLSVYNGMLQFTPVADPGAATSTGNTPVVVTRTLSDLTAADQSRLVLIENVAFDASYDGSNFGTGTNYDIADASGLGVFRTEFFDADYIGLPIPMAAQNITAILREYNGTMQITARSLADFEEYVASPFFAVTFNVDMTDAIEKGLFVNGVDVVNVAGTFNSWDPSDANYQLLQVGETNIYTLTTDEVFEVNDILEFKFVLNNGALWEHADNRIHTVFDGVNIYDGVFAAPVISWANLQWPANAELVIGDPNSQVTIYAQVYIQDVTNQPNAVDALEAWIGFNNVNTDPSTWVDPPVAVQMFDFTQVGSNHQFEIVIDGTMIEGLEAGTYYYGSRFQYGTDESVFGGFDGGFWDGVTNVFGELTAIEPVAATIDPTEFDMYENWDNVDPEFTITWNDASAVTGMSFYDEGDATWYPLPVEMWEVTNDDGVTATLHIYLEHAPAKADKENEHFVEQATWRVEFDLGDPAVGYANIFVKTFLLTIDVQDELGAAVPGATVQLNPYYDNANDGVVYDATNNPIFEVTARGDYEYIVEADGYETAQDIILNVEADATITVVMQEVVDVVISDFPYVQDFNAAELPYGWTVVDNAGTGFTWEFPGQVAEIDSDAAGSGNLVHSTLVSPIFDVSSLTDPRMVYEHFYRNIGNDRGYVNISVDGGVWENIFTYDATVGADPDFAEVVVAINDHLAGATTFQIAFEYNDFDTWAWYWRVNNFIIEETPNVYTVTFEVEDQDGIAINNATVTLDGIVNPEGDYIFADIEPGVYNYTVEAAGYQTAEGSVEVIDGDVILPVTLNILYNVSFNVVDDLANPLENVEVVVTDLGDNIIETLYTDVDGNTPNVELIAGDYIYDAYLIGYYPAEGVIFSVAGDVVVDVALMEAGPILSVDPETFDFGVVVLNNQTDPQTFTSMNVGGDGLVINDVTFDDPSGQFILDDLNDYTGGLSLNTGEQITFDIAFAPIMEGPAMATATIHYNDGTDKTFDVVVNGDGYDPTITEFPWLEDFEGDEFPPLGWNVINVGDGGTQWVVSDAQNITPGGSQSALHSYSSAYYQEGWLITPAIEMPVDNVYKLSFSSFNLYPGDYEKNSVLISVGSPNPVDGDFVEIWSPGSVSAEWVETIESLETYAGETIYIAFVYEGNNAHSWYLDDVAISEIESYTVNFSVVGGNGDLTATANSTAITSGDAVQEGSEVVFSAIPNDGFTVLEWTVDGVPVDGFTEEVLTIESLTANISVTVEFEEMLIVYPLPFFDDFETYIDTDDFVANSDWSIVDADADGNNWYLHYDDVDEINVMASKSWDADAGPLTPENYLITPALEIPELTEENDIIQLSYVVTAGGSNYFEEHYKVVVSTTGNAPEDFIDANIVLEETLTVDESGWNFTLREVDLSDFQNEVIYIAFVHYDCTDMDRLIIKEVGVSVETIVEPVYYTVTFDVEGANGTIEASVDGAAISSGDMVEEGKDVLFTATPDTDYIVKAWYLDGTAIDGETGETYTYTALDADIDVKVEFEYSNFIDDVSVADVNVYPNPANSNATIESDVVIKEITIVGLLGDVIFKQEVGDTIYNVDVSNFVNGIYFIRVATENGLITKRLQVSR